MPSGCNVCNSRIQKLSFFCLWFSFQLVVNDINFGSAKVFQWVPRRHKVLTHGQERLFRKVTSVSIHFFYWMVGHFPLRIATRSQRVKPLKVFCNWHCKRSYTLFLSSCYATLVRVVIGDSTCNAEREFLDPRVTNITPGGHKLKGLNLLF